MPANRSPVQISRDGAAFSPAELEGRLQELSDSSAVLLSDAVELSEKMQEYYPCLLKVERTSAMTEEVKHKAETLAHAGEALWKASSLAYDMLSLIHI